MLTFPIIIAELQFYFDRMRNSTEEDFRSTYLGGVWVEGCLWVGCSKLARGGVVIVWVILTDTRGGGVYAWILGKKNIASMNEWIQISYISYQ